MVLLGTGTEVQARGFSIDSQDLASCPSFLIEVQSLDFGPFEGEFLLGEREPYLSISAMPTSRLNSVVTDSSIVNNLLLGKSVCVVEVAESVVVQQVSTGDLFIRVDDFDSTEMFLDGERILVPMGLDREQSVLTSVTNSEMSNPEISINGVLVYPKAPLILWISGIASAVFVLVALFIFLLTKRKSAANIQTQVGNRDNES